ncbi:MAG: polymerase subunit epsilon [Pseudomonadota bacterium]|jgi:DNA polymerase-3 subunit epsilon|nr:polymerase subunit epsilon [Pseudomonadota bacterium]MDQ5914939.1 polymerase subunit epsilon [Pseudomonadota bacterium]MDQ5944811.1 polymerase subunit epsilon [Pseudomonadota bacterium]
MKLALFYDTETQGLPDFKAPSEAPHQPHIVQLAALLVDFDTRQTISSMDVVIRPNGWTIPDEVAAVHGITTERAEAVGIEEVTALDMFMALWAGPGRLRIAHNEQFDARILRIALKRFYDKPDHVLPVSDTWKEGIADCTAKLATPICQIPPTAKMVKAGFNKFKTANLGDAYRHFTGKELENAHSAMADVLACRDVYFAIQDMHGAKAA